MYDSVFVPGFGDRLRRARHALGMNQAAMAEVVGTSSNTISRWETGRQVPSIEWLPKISAAYAVPSRELSVHFPPVPGSDVPSGGFREALSDALAGLVRGTETSLEEALLARGYPLGQMDAGGPSAAPGLRDGWVPSVPGPFAGAAGVDVLEVAAAAGSGAADMDETPVGVLWFGDHVLRGLRVEPGNCSVISVTGSSMEPTLPEGCRILVDRRDVRLVQGQVYVVLDPEEGLVVKRVSRSGRSWVLDSDNPQVASRPMGPGCEVRGRVRLMIDMREV